MIQHEVDSDSEDKHDLDNLDCDDDHVPELINPRRNSGLKLEKATMLQQTFEERNAKVLFRQSHSKKIELDLQNAMLLDSQSTMDSFCDPNLVDKTCKTDKKMRLKSNGGSMIVSHKASMKGHNNDVWFSKDAITNVIALSDLIKQHRVACDSKDQIFVVHRETQNKPNMEFKMHKNGLHCFDPRDKDFVSLNAVSGNEEGFTQRQIKDAETAKMLSAKLGCPSMKDCKWVIQSNEIHDFPVTAKDVDVAHQIWGETIAALKGKTARKKAVHVARDFVKIPKELLKLHLESFLAADVFFVNKIPFFLTLSRKTCFTAVSHLANRKVETIFKAFEETRKFYLHRGFKITTVHADGEFAPPKALTQAMPGGPRVNLASSSDDVPEIERRIRVAKERCRSARHSLPFNKIPKLMVIYVVFLSLKPLDHFPAKGGVLDTVSPKTIMTGKTPHCKKHLSLQLGQHCQVYKEDTPRNSPLPCTKGAICLGPSSNLQGGRRFVSLHSMKKIVWHSWDASHSHAPCSCCPSQQTRQGRTRTVCLC
jgi:hypothetical protein